MGTRHLTCVVQDGEFKVAQYGQWDGYPEGQGKNICDFIQGADLDMFRERVKEVTELPEKEYEARWAECGADGTGWVNMEVSNRFKEKWPYLSRDCGSDVLHYIMNGECKEVVLATDFGNDSLFCEYAYVLDLDRDLLEFYGGFVKEDHEGGRWAGNERANPDYAPIRLTAEIPFSEIKEHGVQVLLDVAQELQDEVE